MDPFQLAINLLDIDDTTQQKSIWRAEINHSFAGSHEGIPNEEELCAAIRELAALRQEGRDEDGIKVGDRNRMKKCRAQNLIYYIQRRRERAGGDPTTKKLRYHERLREQVREHLLSDETHAERWERICDTPKLSVNDRVALEDWCRSQWPDFERPAIEYAFLNGGMETLNHGRHSIRTVRADT